VICHPTWVARGAPHSDIHGALVRPLVLLRLVIAVLVAAGCRDPEVSALDHVRDAVCACKSSSCAEDALKKVPAHAIKPSAQAQQIARAMMDCLAKLYEADRPSTDPDAPSSAAAGE